MQLFSLKTIIPSLMGAAFYLAASAVPAADLSVESSQDQVCIPITNSVNFVFTLLPQSEPPKITCKLVSVKKLNDDAVKKWQEKDREVIKKCIFDTIYRTNLFAKLGYDINNEMIDAAEAAKKAKAVSQEDSAKFNKESLPNKADIDAELNDIQDAYETMVGFTANGKEAPLTRACAFRTGKTIYIYSEGELHCDP